MKNCTPTSVRFSGQDPLEAVVQTYLEDKAPSEERYLQYYRIQRSLADAIVKAGMAELPGGKRFSHQRRIPRDVLAKVTDTLLAARTAILTCRTFEQLLAVVGNLTSGIHGVGAL